MTDTTKTDTLLAPLTAKVVEAMDRLQVPGVALGLLLDGQEHLAGLGVTNVEHPLPVDGDTLFQIGSTTKTLTATIIARLMEQGRLDLDTPVRTHVPELRLADEAVAARVTLRHLLTHSGGWDGDFFDDTGMGDDALARYVAGLAHLPQITPLGAAYSYNNSGFALAGRVIEVVTGRPYEAVAREMVLDPLGMDHSFFFAADAITYRVAAGHDLRDGQVVVLRPWGMTRATHPVGGLASTARDQMRYARFHLGDGRAPDGSRLLHPETMALMQSPLAPGGGKIDAVGMSWMQRSVAGARIVEHGGATNGQQSAFLMVPERQFALTVLTNAEQGDTLHDEVAAWALAHYLGLEEPAPQALPLDEQALAPFVGRYVSLDSDVDLTVRPGGLLLTLIPKGGFPTRDSPPPPAPPPAPLIFHAPDRVVVADGLWKGNRGDFGRRPDGSIAWLRIGGRIRLREG